MGEAITSPAPPFRSRRPRRRRPRHSLLALFVTLSLFATPLGLGIEQQRECRDACDHKQQDRCGAPLSWFDAQFVRQTFDELL